MFDKNSFRGTDGGAFIVDLILLASVIGIPVWLLKRILKKKN
jgi:hypothetical protein